MSIKTASKIARFIQTQLEQYPITSTLLLTDVQWITFTPSSTNGGDTLINEGYAANNVEKFHGFAFVIFREQQLANFVLNAWPWTCVAERDIGTDRFALEAQRVGFRTLSM